MEHELGGRVGVVEGKRGEVGLEGQGFGVEGEHVHAIVEGLEEAAHGDAVGGVGDGQGVERVGGLVGYGVRVFQKGVVAWMLHFFDLLLFPFSRGSDDGKL